MVKAGATINECMVVEVFAGAARVTASLKQFGMVSSFGTDHVRHKLAAAQVVLADLTTQAGVELLAQWLSNPNVVGIYIWRLRIPRRVHPNQA